MALTPAPTPPSRGQAPATFIQNMNAFLAWIASFVTQANALADDVTAKQEAATAAAAAAVPAAVTAIEKAAAAAADADAAGVARVMAQEAALATAVVSGTSLTSLVIAGGNKVFATQAGRQWLTGTPIIAVDQANPTNFMAGTVSAYAGSSLTIAVTNVGGEGNTVAAWNISVSGIQGPAANAQTPGYLLFSMGIR